jgi:hypothetical protein
MVIADIAEGAFDEANALAINPLTSTDADGMRIAFGNWNSSSKGRGFDSPPRAPQVRGPSAFRGSF